METLVRPITQLPNLISTQNEPAINTTFIIQCILFSRLGAHVKVSYSKIDFVSNAMVFIRFDGMNAIETNVICIRVQFKRKTSNI